MLTIRWPVGRASVSASATPSMKASIGGTCSNAVGQCRSPGGYGEQHNVASLSVGEHASATDERVGVQEPARTGKQ